MRDMFNDFVDWIKKYRRQLAVIFIFFLAFFIIVNIAYYIGCHFSKTCTACHFMQPFYDQWEKSSHSDVPCIKCHPYEPTFFTTHVYKYFTGNYRPRPITVVHDKACLDSDCHAGIDQDGSLTFKGTIGFKHSEHMGELKRGHKLSCASCHSYIVQGEHMTVDDRTCNLCHFKGAEKGQSITGCDTCHGVPEKTVEHEGFSFNHVTYIKEGVTCDQCHVEVVRGDGSVSEERCYDCHAERYEEGMTSQKLHERHVNEKGVKCFSCHEEIKHGRVKMIQALEVKCENCHVKLHSSQKEMYMGASARGVEDTPSRMFAAQVSCDGCHTKVSVSQSGEMEISGKNLEAERESCVVCHGEGYDKMMDGWIKASKQLVSQTAPVVREARQVLTSLKTKKTDKELAEATELIDDAVYNLDLIRNGKGAHNVDYMLKIADAIWEESDTALKLMRNRGLSQKKPTILTSEDEFCTGLCHGAMGVPEEINFEEMHHVFPHQFHHDELDIACVDCHSFENHKQRIITLEGCMMCHHDNDSQDSCSNCHKYQYNLYYGKVNIPGVSADKDIMADSGIDCSGCHDLNEIGHTIDRVKQACVDCHDEGYDAMLIEWEQELLAGTNDILVALYEFEEKASVMNNAQANKLLAEVRKGYEMIADGKGVHNYMLASDIISSSKKKLEKVKKLLK